MGLTFGRCRDASGPLMDTAMRCTAGAFPRMNCVSGRISRPR